MINLGEKVRDRITKFVGIVVGRAVYLNGCVRLQVQSQKLKDGRPMDGDWIDEGQLEKVSAPFLTRLKAATGGPRDSPRGFSDPK